MTLADDRFNLAWWGPDGIVGAGPTNTTDGRPGVLWGAAPGEWMVRPGTTAAHGLTSIVIVVQSGACGPHLRLTLARPSLTQWSHTFLPHRT